MARETDKPTAVFESASPAATEEFAAAAAAAAEKGSVFLLRGELGSGKTVFVRGVARGLGVSDGVVSSPTYVLQHVYKGGRLPLYHLDLYRLSGDREEFEAAGLAALFEDPDGVFCLEWPERLEAGNDAPPFFTGALNIELEHLAPERRRLTVGLPYRASAEWRAVLRGAAAAARDAAGEFSEASSRRALPR